MRILLSLLIVFGFSISYAYEECAEPDATDLSPTCQYAQDHGMVGVQYLCCVKMCSPNEPINPPDLQRYFYFCSCDTSAP